jgi:hypothetical protein
MHQIAVLLSGLDLAIGELSADRAAVQDKPAAVNIGILRERDAAGLFGEDLVADRGVR